MAQDYDHKTIEHKWDEEWYKANLYEAVDFDSKPKKYILAELPYPSGKALHAGHMMRFTVPDIYSRYLRMKGYNVLFPIGWDAFGLPAENYAVTTGTHPRKLINDTVINYKKSIRRMGYSIDWNREINTTDPKYYKWTQWIFLKFFKAGLAKYKEMPIWWCDKLKTVLSDEEVLNDKSGNKISERGEFPVEKKKFKQWILDIRKYANRLIDGLKNVDYPESIKSAQINWIGRSEGALVDFEIADEKISVFTTRPDTLYGVTFLVIAPEYPLVTKLKTLAQNKSEIENYLKVTEGLSDLERTSTKEKSGVLIKGISAKHPLTNKNIPVFIANYVLMDYGTGAVMGVPAHDERDYDFAKKYNLPIVEVIKNPNPNPNNKTEHYDGMGIVINSGEYNGLTSQEFYKKIIKRLKEEEKGHADVAYKIRDWIFSRQRYWGEPIPLIHRQNGSIEAICDPDVPEEVAKVLPLTLPEVPDFNPTSDGLSPLEKNKEWVATKDKEGKPAKRETNTMPNWAGSCWYYIRYIDPKNDKAFADYEKMKYWLPVDRYFGGAEHTTMHLLYSRFWHQFLFDQGLVPTPEPYAWRMNGGLLLGADGRKMSKSLGNVVEPADLMDRYGTDSLRMFVAFLGPYEETYPWNNNGIKATNRLLRIIYELRTKVVKGYTTDKKTLQLFNLLVKHITEMIEGLRMNTCISEFMIFVSHIKDQEKIDLDMWQDFLKILAPFAPFIAEELWQEINGYKSFSKENSVHKESWPKFLEDLTLETVSSIPVQINGKLRGQIDANEDDTEETITKKLGQLEKLKPYLGNKTIKRLVYVPGKIVNVVN